MHFYATEGELVRIIMGLAENKEIPDNHTCIDPVEQVFGICNAITLEMDL